MLIKGDIISGEFDEYRNEFALQQVKHFYMESTINGNQLNTLYDYLKKHVNEDEGQIITLYDQMPVSLTSEETSHFIGDLEKIRTTFHNL